MPITVAATAPLHSQPGGREHGLPQKSHVIQSPESYAMTTMFDINLTMSNYLIKCSQK